MSDRPAVSLRAFDPGDAAAVHRWFNNPEATRTLMERATRSPRSRRGPGSSGRSRHGGEDRKYAIVVEGHDEPVGFTALYGLGARPRPSSGP